jgi:hypothetical protein
MTNSSGDKGSHCLKPQNLLKNTSESDFTNTKKKKKKKKKKTRPEGIKWPIQGHNFPPKPLLLASSIENPN